MGFIVWLRKLIVGVRLARAEADRRIDGFDRDRLAKLKAKNARSSSRRSVREDIAKEEEIFYSSKFK